ncbi:hypothetical protein Tco_0028995 [Tanacetum coccineum]
MIEADRLLAKRLQAREQEELTDEEKNKSFAEIQKLFDKAMTRVKMFVDKDTELVKESSKKAEAEMAEESNSKRVGEELEQESTKKPRHTYCLVNYSKSLTAKTWKIYESWLKLSIGIQGQKKVTKECYGVI